jgi:hypothetical protein
VIILYLLGLMVSTSLSAYVNPVEGQNLWRMVSGIAYTVDDIESDLDVIGSLFEQMISVTEILDQDVLSVGDVLSSQLDVISVDLSEFDHFLGSLVEVLDAEVLSVGDILISQLDSLASVVDSVSDIMISQLETIDADVLSMQDTILSAIDTTGQTIVSLIDQLEDCTVGVAITQVPYVISAPGTYRVCKDLTLTTGASPLISITTSNVSLDLGGTTLTTGATNYGVAVNSGSAVHNIHIFNGTIAVDDAGTQEAIIVWQASNVIVEDISVFNGPNVNISVGYNCTGVILRRCVCTGNNTQVVSGIPGLSATPGALYIDGQYGNVTGTTTDIIVEDCTASAGSVRGVSCNNCTSISIIDTQVFDATAAGFRFDTGVVSVECFNCSAINSCFGFNILNTSALLTNCAAVSNDGNGFTTGTGSLNTVFVECEAYNNSTGFDIFGHSDLLKRCVVSNNTIGIMVESTAINTQILDTCPVNNTTNFIDNGSNTTFVNLATVFEILMSAIEALQPCCSIIETLDATVTSVSDLMLSAIDTFSSTADTLAPCLVGVAITPAMIPYTISAPGLYTLCGNVTTAGAPAITINASNVTLDLNNHTITNTNNRGITCNPGLSNISIAHGVIIPGLEAIAVGTVSTGCQDVQIYDIQAIDAALTAFSIQNSTGVIIDSCTCYNSNETNINTLDGAFYLINCGNVSLTSSSVIGSVWSAGVYVLNPTGAIELTGCSVSGAQNYGFRLQSTSSSVALNIALNNCHVYGTTFNFVGGGFYTNGVGTFPNFSTGPLFESCSAIGTEGPGFYFLNIQECVLRNCITSNGFDGILLVAVTNSVVYATTASANLIGFAVTTGSMGCTFRQCSALNNETGFSIDTPSSNIVLDECLASGNTTVGIDNAGSGVFILDTRSAHGVTSLNPAYSLNAGNPDVPGSATVIITS